MVKGEPLTPPAGRADDYSWPRREIAVEQAPTEVPAASMALSASLKPKKHHR
jgi:hypothetical protein